METPNFYAVIPANIRYAEDLSDLQKLLYWELTALSDKTWYCWANNSYFANLYKKRTHWISERLNDMFKKWYINIIFDSERWNQRKIYMWEMIKTTWKSVKTTITEKNNTITENCKPPLQKNVNPLTEKCKHININNNTSNNNIISNDIILEQSSNENFWDPEINEFEEIIKTEVSNLWFIYKKGKYERHKIKILLTWKEFWKICEGAGGMSRADFCRNIIKISWKLSFWAWKIYNAETFYKFYAQIYNEALRIKREKEVKTSSIVYTDEIIF